VHAHLPQPETVITAQAEQVKVIGDVHGKPLRWEEPTREQTREDIELPKLRLGA
jgi:hypothetical protein